MPLSLISLLIAALLVVTAPLSGCGRATSGPPGGPPPPPEVTVTTPAVQKVTEYFEYVGRVRAIDRVEVRAQLSGYLISKGFAAGEEVAKGQTLFEIDPRPFEAALAAANARKAAAKASLAEATARLKRYDRALESGAITRDEYEGVLAAKLTAEADIEAADAQIRTADLDLEFATITSPIDGRIGESLVDPGNLVVGGVGSEPLATIVSEDPIFVAFDVDERAALFFWEGNREELGTSRPENIRELGYPVRIGLPGEKDYPHEGVVEFVDNEIDPTTGTIRVRGEFANATRFLAPGMFVRVRLPKGDEPTESLVIPDRAVATDANNKYLLVADPEDVARYREITLGPLTPDGRVIRDGLAADDRVILDGHSRVRPGMSVAPSTDPGPAVDGDTPEAPAATSPDEAGPAEAGSTE